MERREHRTLGEDDQDDAMGYVLDDGVDFQADAMYARGYVGVGGHVHLHGDGDGDTWG